MGNFKLGKLAATRSVSDRMQRDLAFAAFVSKSIRRYKEGDWGDISNEDRTQNNHAVDHDEEILAVYEQDSVKEPMKIWIITEWDRSATTILFPEEH